MSKSMKWLSAVLLVILLALLGVYAALRIPFLQAKNAMPQDARLQLSVQDDGSLLLTWDPADTADAYRVVVRDCASDGTGQTPALFSALCEAPRCVLPREMPEDRPLELSIRSQKAYRTLGRSYIRLGDEAVSVRCYLNRPKIEGLTAAVDAEHAKVYLSWTGWQGDSFRLSLLRADGSTQPLRELRHVGAELQFGPGADLPIPAYGETVTFVVDALRETDGLTFFGNLAETASVTREDFLGRTLQPEWTGDGENSFVLTWNETKGDRYVVRRIDNAGIARVAAEIPADGERLFRTGTLPPFSTCSFEIAALGGDAAGDGYAAPPVRVELTTAQALRGAAVWALKDLEIRSAPNGGEVIGTMGTARAYCALEEKDGWLRIAAPQQSGWVDGGGCMIDLADYVGDLCSYDVTNSYSSLYMVHDYAIPEVTDTVVSGYEQVALSPDAYLVPLLYPTAKKLIAAAEAMAADGYRIRIYDSFRPNRATRSIYDLTEKVMNDPIPEETFTGRPAADMPKLSEDDEPLTYAQLMTNGMYGLGSFLASGGSMHNFGVAMDLTMERADDRAELEMQTAMHDLSWYSAIARNNANANLLRGYMLAAGFGGLVSEWWHFQDNEAFSALHPANRWAGVTPEGWRLDDGGWRFRLADGTYCRASERTIDGVAYVFDEAGYAAAR